MTIFNAIFGCLLVIAGRSLFWLSVGVVGFLIGVQCAGSLGLANEWMELLLAVTLGCLGAVLAVSFEWLVVVFGMGFLGGGYLLMNIFSMTVAQGAAAWTIFVIGGIIGICLMVIVFDWALIVISSLLGAMLMANAFQGNSQLHTVLLIGITIAGIVIQSVTLSATVSDNHSVRRI